MPSDIEMGDSDSSILDTEISPDLEIIANIKLALEWVVHRRKKKVIIRDQTQFLIFRYGDQRFRMGIFVGVEQQERSV